jgi:plasmid stabilization system protein ParE
VRVRYTPRAFADREAIFEYINQHNPRAAREVKAFIARRVAELGESPPVHHRMIARLGVHALYLGRYPYIVYYRVGRDEIAIVHIRHAARRPWQGEGD